MTEISIDQLLAKIPNKFLLVSGLAERAKQIAAGSLPYIDAFDPENPINTAILEMATDKIKVGFSAEPKKHRAAVVPPKLDLRTAFATLEKEEKKKYKKKRK